ncbi:MAG: hypothetical protein GYB67_02370 [Chloroflexi bacterium]|nr:hypothetical protein [Chloroflexota bacterium]
MTDDLYTTFAGALRRALDGPRPQRGVLGYTLNGAYQVADAGDQTRYFVRFPDGTFARAAHRGRVAPIPDLPVLVTRDASGEVVITGSDPERIAAFAGPRSGGVIEVGLHGHHRFSGMAYPIDPRLLTHLAVRVEQGLVIRAEPGRYTVGAELHWWSDTQTLDLTSQRPAASGQHRWAIVGIDPTQTPHTLIAVAGAPQLINLPLDPAALAAIPFTARGYLPLAAARLAHGQTTLAERDFEALYDLARGSAGPFRAAITTTDATTTTLASVPVAEESALTLRAVIAGRRDDTGEAIGGEALGVFRRASGGNVAAVGSPTVVIKTDSGGAPTFTLAADTTTQAARLRVTGLAATTIHWAAAVEALHG